MVIETSTATHEHKSFKHRKTGMYLRLHRLLIKIWSLERALPRAV